MAKQLGWGARILQFAVLAALAVMTSAAGYQTWKQVSVPDLRTASPPAPDDIPAIDWATLRNGGEPLNHYDGSRVRIPGFVVPLEDKEDKVAEFLLVPYVGACIHTPPPPANQIVQVRLMDRQPLKVSLIEPVWVIGDLRIASVKSRYGDAAFQLEAVRVEPYEEKQ